MLPLPAHRAIEPIGGPVEPIASSWIQQLITCTLHCYGYQLSALRTAVLIAHILEIGTSEAKPERVNHQLSEITLSGPARPDPTVPLFRSLYLWNRAFDRQAVFYAGLWVVPSFKRWPDKKSNDIKSKDKKSKAESRNNKKSTRQKVKNAKGQK